MFLRSVAAALVAGSVCSTAVFAQDLVPWGASDYWDVMVDPSLGDGCLIQSEFEDGSLVRIGFDRTTGFGYVTVFNTAWGDIEDGGIYPIDFTLDGEQFAGQAKGMYLNGVPGADIEFDNADFFMSIAQRQTMTMYHDGYEVLSIDLTGTMSGLDAVLECQNENG